MAVKRLVVNEFVVDEDTLDELPAMGFKYSYFLDPETGEYYRPKSTFEVTGENLEELFERVPAHE